MARDRGPRCKKMRRHGDMSLISGLRSLDSKCKADVPPGQHGNKKARQSDFAVQLHAKQKLRLTYGVLERQFRGYYKKAAKQGGSTGENLLHMLERRLDNVVYRLGFAVTRAEARQLVSHKAISVNGQTVNIPSYQVCPGDVVSVREKSRNQARIQGALALAEQRAVSEWVEADAKQMQGTFKRMPDMSELPPDYNVNLVVELYSK